MSYTRLADVPIEANQMGFEQLGGLLYFVAGRTVGAHSQKVYAYNPATNAWTEKADYPIAVQSLIVRAVGGKLYGIGGYNSQTNTYYGNVYEYDPTANTWTPKTSMPTAREDFASAVVGTKIYCYGGINNTGNVIKKLEVYDTATDTWDVTRADMPDLKWSGDFGAALDGKIYAIGSAKLYGEIYPALAPVLDCWVYDPDTDTWSDIADIPFSACYKEVEVINGKLYAISGATTATDVYTNRAFSYDPTADAWAEELLAPYAAQGTGLTSLNDKIYMAGGTGNKYLYQLGY